MAEVEKIRPNIRIEIHNNLTESTDMDVDKNEKSENEEGEITDDDEMEPPSNTLANSIPEVTNRLWPNTKGVFTTGINIFDKAAQEKLEERAKRFALKPEEIHKFTDEDLQILHDSLGITADNENEVRFEAVHILGTENMSTEDVLEYFSKYAPIGIEWIDDNCCNVVWLDNISAARALHFMSKYVKGMPARGPCNPFAKEFIDEVESENIEGDGKSILLKNSNREIELKDDDMPLEKKQNVENSVDISAITIPIPPGYWRLGDKHPKSKCILVRFALKTDKKAYKAEKFSKYYKKYGNPNYGGLKGVISETRKREIRSIFERNRELRVGKNPWGSLAKNWDRDAKFREKTPVIPEEEKPIEIKNPNILARLGTKRKREESEDEGGGQENQQQVNEEVEEQQEDTQVKQKPSKKSKFPRMRMYADEEEEKIRRKKILQTIKKQTEELAEDKTDNNDLRNILGLTHGKPPRDEQIIEDVADLGSKLRNRSRNMVFTIEREPEEIDDIYESKVRVREDIRSLLAERMVSSSEKNSRKRISPPRRSPDRRMDRRRSLDRRQSPTRRRRTPSRRSPFRRRSLERTLHSDRMYSSRTRHYSHRLRDYESNHGRRHYDGKPKSKVAVVIKTQKRPAVASTIWSRVKRASDEEEEESESSSSKDSSEEGSEESSSTSSSDSSESESESESESKSSESSEVKRRRHIDRPGFKRIRSHLSDKVDHRSPLKITMMNDRFKKK